MYLYNAIVRRVVDGDTVMLDIDLGLNIWQHNQCFRLEGIDAPELGTPEGEKAKLALTALIAGTAVTISTKKDRQDPYRRYVADVMFGRDNASASQWMLKNGYAVPWPTPRKLESLEERVRVAIGPSVPV